jgi:hypothetical protein
MCEDANVLPIEFKTQYDIIMNNPNINFTTINELRLKTYKNETHPTISFGPAPLIGLCDITLKYRPHIKMGDYWVFITVTNSQLFRYHIYYRKQNHKGTWVWEYAHHPHIMSGSPCLGEFERFLTEALINGNFVTWISTFRKYLESYNGRSTYVKGTKYKKHFYIYRMVSDATAYEEFGKDIQLRQVLTDPMRWGYHNDLAGEGRFQMIGQELCSYNFSKFGSMYESRYSNSTAQMPHPIEIIDTKVLPEGAKWFDNRNVNYMTYNGYVIWVSKLLEISMLEAQSAINRILNNLYSQSRGLADDEEEQRLKGIWNEWQYIINPMQRRSPGTYQIRFGTSLANSWKHQRHGAESGIYVRLDDVTFEHLQVVYHRLNRKFGGPSNGKGPFCGLLTEPAQLGNKLATIIRNDKCDAVKYKSFFKKAVEEDDSEETYELAMRIREQVLNGYLEKIEKEKKRCIDEYQTITKAIRGVQSASTKKSSGQASLFA